MEDILSNWAGLIGYFLLTGMVYEATKRTVNAKEGDSGFKGVFYVWGRVALLPLGIAAGVAGHYTGIPIHGLFGDEVGGAVLAGGISAAVAALAYSQIIGIAKARLKHKEAKNGKPK